MSNISELLKLDDYCVITFNTTSQALKGEKVLKEMNWSCVMMPTPREISTSCGLALKMRPEEIVKPVEILRSNDVDLAGIYQLTKRGSSKEVTALDI